jgi:hypothetical protein
MNEINNNIYDVESEYNYDGELVNFRLTSSPTAAEKVLFVDSVVNTLVSDNYNYIIRDLIFDYMFIAVFTNVDISEIIELKESEDEDASINVVNMIERLVKETDIADIVKDYIGYDVVDELANAVDKGIEYKTGIHVNPISDAIASLLNMLEEKLSSIDTQKTMEMANILSNMSGELTADKIVEAYANSNIFNKKE